MVKLKICDFDRQSGKTDFVIDEIIRRIEEGNVAVISPAHRSQRELIGRMLDLGIDMATNKVYYLTPYETNSMRGLTVKTLILEDADHILNDIGKIVRQFPEADTVAVVGSFPKHINVRAMLT